MRLLKLRPAYAYLTIHHLVEHDAVTRMPPRATCFSLPPTCPSRNTKQASHRDLPEHLQSKCFWELLRAPEVKRLEPLTLKQSLSGMPAAHPIFDVLPCPLIAALQSAYVYLASVLTKFSVAAWRGLYDIHNDHG
ncbi:hypothetical protein O3P69_001343 [Scylla paramamosain]|uniref:Uncharacterized protein n=1 Tax=Scylla paramamosain TaxID=85552 RepID=A0AAW0USJ8_SCYPA